MTIRRTVMFTSLLSATLLLGGCSDPEWVAAYEECQSTMVAQSEKIKAEASSENAMAKSMGDMALSLGMAACETIKNTCESDPDSKGCRAIVDSFSEEQQ